MWEKYLPGDIDYRLEDYKIPPLERSTLNINYTNSGFSLIDVTRKQNWLLLVNFRIFLKKGRK